jgi:hypothetical protein
MEELKWFFIAMVVIILAIVVESSVKENAQAQIAKVAIANGYEQVIEGRKTVWRKIEKE